MNKKKLSPTLKKLYKPFQMIFGFSLVVCFIQTLIQLMLENGIPINSLTETIGFVLLWICVIFGYLGFKYILPIILSATLGNIREKHKKYSQLTVIDNGSSYFCKLCVAIQLIASALLISKNYGKDISFVIY